MAEQSPQNWRQQNGGTPPTQSTSSNKVYKIVDQYVIDKDQLLGKGSYGQVFSGMDANTNKQVAVKVIPMEIFNQSHSRILQAIKNEIRNMQMLHHANIVELYDVKKSPNNLYLVVEYCNSGNLERLLAKNNSRLSEYQALKIAREIVQGYRCLYDSNIVHRDLKPANLLLHNGEIKISDFGFSKVVEAGMEERVLQSYVGSPQYMSPQILAQEQYSSKTDVWSFGLILYEMLYGKTPWQGKSPNDLLDKIEKFEVRFPDVPIVGEPLKRLLSAMLRREEKDRLSWEEIFENAHFTEQTKQAQHNIEESLKSIELFCKNDKLVQAKALNRLYYENNRVITSAYECAKRDRINKIMLSNQEQGGGGVQPFQEELSGMDEELQSHTQVGGGGSNLYQNHNATHLLSSNANANNNGSTVGALTAATSLLSPPPIMHSKGAAFAKGSSGGGGGAAAGLLSPQTQDERFSLLFNQQRIDQANKHRIQRICEYFIHKRNLAAFYMLVSTELFDCQDLYRQGQPQSSIFVRCIFLLLKRQKMLLFRLYKQLKQSESEKHNRFSPEDFAVFLQSEERTLLLEFIKSDINISKLYFCEFLAMSKTALKQKRKAEEFETTELQKLAAFEDILNNKLSNKEQFKELWNRNMSEFDERLKEFIKKNFLAERALIQAPLPLSLAAARENGGSNKMQHEHSTSLGDASKGAVNDPQKAIVLAAYYIRMLAEAPQNFKFSFEKRIDFLKLYEDVERLSSESLCSKIVSTVL